MYYLPISISSDFVTYNKLKSPLTYYVNIKKKKKKKTNVIF